MSTQVILLDDIDIYAKGHVKKIIKVKEQRTFKRDKLINNQYSIEVDNASNFYSINNAVSYFKNIRWRYGSCKIYNENDDLIWDGIIKKIRRSPDNGIAYIDTINALHQKWNTKVAYVSSGWETVATSAKNLMDNYSVIYNEKTIIDSINKLIAEECYAKVNFDLDDQITLMQALEKLAEFACADCYSHLNEVLFKHFQKYTGGVKVTLNESDIEKFGMIDDNEEDIINQYRIGYDGDLEVPTTDSDTTGIGRISRQNNYFGVHDLPEMDSSESDSQIQYKDSVSADYIGRCYIYRTHRDLLINPKGLEKISFALKGTHRDWIDIETYFRLNWSDESWVNKLFEFFTTEIDYDSNVMKLLAYEVQE